MLSAAISYYYYLICMPYMYALYVCRICIRTSWQKIKLVEGLYTKEKLSLTSSSSILVQLALNMKTQQITGNEKSVQSAIRTDVSEALRGDADKV